MLPAPPCQVGKNPVLIAAKGLPLLLYVSLFSGCGLKLDPQSRIPDLRPGLPVKDLPAELDSFPDGSTLSEAGGRSGLGNGGKKVVTGGPRGG